jgi:chemotaxis methyl-accepting protein methylase
MVAAFQERLPGVSVVCEPVETSSFFNRQFDGVVAWGLLFLLPIDAQLALIQRVASALEPGGSLLFTAPEQVCQWQDSLTGRQSASPGAETYRATLSAAGLTLVGEYEDEGNNHYFDATKP